MTTLLVAILTSFLILTTPNTTYSLIYFLKKESDLFDDMTFNHRWITSPGNLMLTCYYSLNFYLYCLANRSGKIIKHSKKFKNCILIKHFSNFQQCCHCLNSLHSNHITYYTIITLSMNHDT